jgi:starch-binding outer membrane protein, SusD/RagB family
MTLIAGCGGALAGCSDLTDVTNTGIVQPASENTAAGAAAWYVGGTQRFVGAAQGDIVSAALITDEWITGYAAGSNAPAYLDARRAGTDFQQTGASSFSPSHAALVTLRFATAALQQYAPTPGSRIGQMLAYQGYLEVYLAEQFCNGIPFSTIDLAGNVTYGSATTTANTYARAIAHFDSAIAVSGDSARVLNLARVGKARALVNLGRFGDAAALVTTVSTTFVYNLDITASVLQQQNSLFSQNTGNKVAGVPAGSDGVNGINWVAANDPRVRTTSVGKAFDGVTDLYSFAGFTSTASPVRIATGIEARLVQAEAALQANNNDAATTGTGWLGILNTLRATAITPAMTPLADPGSFAARVDLLFRERAFWLYLTGDRFPSMRRLIRHYGRAQNTVFPSGTYRDGQPYGSEVNLVPPTAQVGGSEAPNPNYTGCIDRNA